MTSDLEFRQGRYSEVNNRRSKDLFHVGGQSFRYPYLFVKKVIPAYT